ncbi:MAG: DUF72 domain-containing protein [Chloroflexota bacterium]|nr:DUF72 domain-containing protein [Chloroflexota bacterium]
MFYIGCPMWGYKEWVGSFFPARTPASDFLRMYSRRLSAVEGNTTFYALPSVETVSRWRQETPETFRFCPKISRDISHAARLDEKRDETRIFVERMRGLGTRLGPIFLQLPPALGPAQLGQLQAFLNFWPREVRLAVEVRHPAFFTQAHTESLNELLGRYNVARVLMDTRPIRIGSEHEQQVLQARERKPNLPLQIALTSDMAFVRYIGNPSMEANERFLAEWARQIGQWLAQGITVYAFCHCPFEEHSPGICAELYKRVTAFVPLPPLPERTGTEPEQPRLF